MTKFDAQEVAFKALAVGCLALAVAVVIRFVQLGILIYRHFCTP